MRLRDSLTRGLGARVSGAVAIFIGSTWLLLWFTGVAPRWAAHGANVAKTNMALSLVLAGAALLLLAPLTRGSLRRRLGLVAGFIVFAIGALTLSEHLFSWDLRIDKLLATEPAGAVGTTSPNRIGPPGSLSLVFLGAGLVLLDTRHRRFAPWFGLGVCVVNLVPAVGFAYGIAEFYNQPRITGIAWSTVIALLVLGFGLLTARAGEGPAPLLLADDPGGAMLRRLWPAVVIIPLVLGFLKVWGRKHDLFDTVAGTGILVIALVVVFSGFLWISAARLSRASAAQARAEAELREIESRVKVARAVSAERQRLNDVLNILPAYVILLSPDYHVPFANRFFEERFGRSNGKRCFEYLFNRTEPCENCETYTVMKTHAPHEWEWLGPDGRNYEIHDFPFTDADGSPLIMEMGIDVTARKEAQADLKEANERLEERTAKLQELVGELEHFSYSITHDMRAPLRAMKGFGEVVSLMCETCDRAEPKEFLKRISVSADRMDALIRDALNYSRSLRQELPLEEVDTNALLRGILDTYPEFQATKAHISVEGTLPPVLANEAGLTQCFSNLLDNAVKFVRAGETPEIRIRADEREGRARIWVEDKGIGISKEMLPRVFDMFSRGSASYEGTGIGLALVRKVTQRMGGRAGVESESGKGSRFWVEFKRVTR